MADFVAVIRRTVDGLSENTPEMRDRVYEKARAAVRRQLENMNPRPSDDMINRQLAKLENAIVEVDSEYAEALPALEETEVVEEATEAVAAESPVEDVVSEPEAQPEPVGESQPIAVAEEAAPEAESTAAPDHDAAVHEVPAPYTEHYVEAAEVAPAERVAEEPVAEHVEATEAPVEEPRAPVVEEPQADAPVYEAAEYSEPAPVESYEETVAPPSIDEEARSVEEPTWDDVPAVAAEEKSAASEWELPEWETASPVAKHAAPTDQQVGEEEPAHTPELLGMHPVEELQQHAPAETPRAEAELPKVDTARNWSFDDNDPFAPLEERRTEKSAEPEIADWSWPVEKTGQTASTDTPQSQQDRAGTAWDHIDDLLGFEGATAAATAGAAASTAAREPERGAEAPAPAASRPASYRATPKPSRFSIKRLAVAAVILLALGGGGFAYWQNREAGNAWLSGIVASVTSAISNIGGSPAQEGAPPAETQGESTQQEPARHDDTAVPDNSSTKFTQRLLGDGSEVDNGPATASGESAAQEGKSVAQQTEASKPVETATAQGGTAGQAAGTPPAGQQTGGQPTTPEIAIANGEKMFLYEERLGQSSPTAIPGTVAWSVKEESPGGDAKPEPAIQAQITIPDRGLTALMTIKRNADESLPASHVVEFVFSLPPNFEGGAIDSVQRVSMKRTEQDRGDALIAVPAKITDDFHMIALNDSKDAIGNNTELLRSRSWIDIPLTYRNGRRALLTLEKGPSGTDAFNQAMRAWTAAPATDAATNSQ
ncbi:hypothetical protein [Sinorhizobium sp. Sb3]|uniref:hypothetical protein n=1 Tax=Sinorhizobium/Ensifer group TaxID=227292 RepID=UPI00071D1559|nr:hypothetical protein [Sinorhizobium sp. Sb3]KSV82738.1 hypothetical protein N183_13810 [Sinorhizobium sp. Sb3]